MSTRIMLSPPFQFAAGKWTAKAATYATGGYSNIFPSKSDGSPAHVWVMTIGRAADWAAADADATVQTIHEFASDDQNVVKNQLQSVTFGSLTSQKRSAITTILNGRNVPIADFDLSSTLSAFIRRLTTHLMDKDFSTGLGFHF